MVRERRCTSSCKYCNWSSNCLPLVFCLFMFFSSAEFFVSNSNFILFTFVEGWVFASLLFLHFFQIFLLFLLYSLNNIIFHLIFFTLFMLKFSHSVTPTLCSEEKKMDFKDLFGFCLLEFCVKSGIILLTYLCRVLCNQKGQM